MKTPVWESSVGALNTLLRPGRGVPRQYGRADLYTIELIDGGFLYYAAGTRSITYPGAPSTYIAKQVGIDIPGARAVGHQKVGLDVDTWQVEFTPRAINPLNGTAYPDKIGSTPWLAAVTAGILDGAIVTVDRAYFAFPWPAPTASPIVPVGLYRIFVGRIAEVDIARTGALLHIASALEYMTIQMPRNLFQARCSHVLFGAGCNVSGSLPAASFAVAGTVGSGSTQIAVKTLSAPGGSGTYVLGRIAFTTGLNAGFQRMIVGYDAGTGTVTLRNKLPFAPTIGDAFLAYPGCNKTPTSCTAFGNLNNFGGEPNIPVAEAAI